MFLRDLAAMFIVLIGLPFIIPMSITRKMELHDFIALCSFAGTIAMIIMGWRIIN